MIHTNLSFSLLQGETHTRAPRQQCNWSEDTATESVNGMGPAGQDAALKFVLEWGGVESSDDDDS